MFSLGKIAQGDQSRPGHVDLPGAPHTISRLRHLFRSIRPASPVLGHAGNLGLPRGLPLRSLRYSTSVKVFAWSLSTFNSQRSTFLHSSPVTRHSSLLLRPCQKGFTTILQIKAFTAIRIFEQAFHFLRSRDQV